MTDSAGVQRKVDGCAVTASVSWVESGWETETEGMAGCSGMDISVPKLGLIEIQTCLAKMKCRVELVIDSVLGV